MAPLPASSCSIHLVSPGNAFINKKDSFLTTCNGLRKSRKQVLLSHRCTLPMSTSVRLFPQFRIGCALHPRLRTHVVAATNADVAVEETEVSAPENVLGEVLETPSPTTETSESPSPKSDASPTNSQTKRTRPGRKSEMPPVKNEELIPGATFVGKVRSIQPFGAFVDFGAFTDGLVHVSRLSDGFVKDVGDVVSVGQEVTVKLVEANTETGRISLTMRSDDASKNQKQKDAPNTTSRAPRKTNQRRDEVKKSKFVKGQELEGTVKNVVRSGAFISLPEGEEGFLPSSEEADDVGSFVEGSLLQIGQEVKVRVLNINRGKVQLTMKKEDASGEIETVQGVVHAATNPFVLAFQRNKDIAAFLDEQEKLKEEKPNDPSTNLVDKTETTEKNETVSDSAQDEGSVEMVTDKLQENEVVDNTEITDKNEEQEILPSDSPQVVDSAAKTIDEESKTETLPPESTTSAVTDAVDDENADVASDSSESINGATLGLEESEVNSEEPAASASLSNVEDITEALPPSDGAENEFKVEESEVTSEAPAASASLSNVEDVTEALPPSDGAEDEVKDELKNENSIQEELASVPEEVNEPEVLNLETNGSSPGEQVDVPSSPERLGKEDVPEVIENESAITNEVAKIETTGELTEKSDATVQKETSTKATISPALVKQLREETGAGMMDCKKALSETGGDMVKAQEYLRKKGLASADKKASRTTAEGRIGSYIHDSRIGVLIEVNCETDFVSRGDIFKELVEDLAMQVAACPQVQYLVADDVPKEIVAKEREIEMQKEDLISKPEQIRSKIVDGRIKKRLDELALLEQPFIKNDKIVVKDYVKQTIATIGENIKVNRFVRYNLGEGLEKKSQDFAAEVAAQTAAKPTTPKEEPAAAPAETPESVEKPVKATISPSLVKQLREETGAGMMDCKKALSETGGDLEKAQEYLRKKGLSSADKKSSRLAAEGRIGSYIHDARIGVLIEVNCETDFVGRSENFKTLVDDLAMQVVACPQVQYVSIEDVPAEIVNKEKELEMQREDLQSKPENIREKIVEGRISKRLGELALLEQPFIKDDSLLVKDLVKQTVAALGENIKVRRFTKFTLGEESKPAESSEEEPAVAVN
ncbi:OLC1v1037388C6 [Oldenlandia corymbosa var. corymbosa]|uniref:Elongation factor Ts, mitochondrial n=1 Tax=Oldenlandia corymbosa var. corymbosa TaxID=529605 RepID=A0AAV1CZP0_OLDCO|nr:OLC1v1037388C6 [Oldenlandia corymbosa var. corymbosa]